jgi:diguanylate cyclase (GGDEF)-like protein
LEGHISHVLRGNVKDKTYIHLKNDKIYEQVASPLIDGDIVLGTVWNIRDVTENQRTVERLNEMAMLDSLTGIYNRRSFIQTAEEALIKANNLHHPMSVMMLDVDLFKRVNDQYGHQEGDQVLIRLSNEMTSSFRKSDVIARIGGEEFAVLLEFTTLENGVKLAEKFRKRFEKVKFNHEDGTFYCTISIGVSSLLPNETFSDFMKRSDEALYEAKETGRNKVVHG